MSSQLSLILGMLIGAGVGYLLERLPVSPLAQSVGAAVLSSVIVAFARTLRWIMRASEQAGVAAVSVGIAEVLVVLFAVSTLAVGLHWVLGWAGRTLTASVVTHRPIILGGLGGLCGALTLPVGVALRGTP